VQSQVKQAPQGQQSQMQYQSQPSSQRPSQQQSLRNSNQPGYSAAGIGVRIGAYAVDMSIWGFMYMILLLGTLGNDLATICLSMLFPFVFTIINTVAELLTSATIGKAIFRLRVRRKDGGEALSSQILLRNVIKMLGIFVLIFSANNQLLEDRATNSMVCVKR
jgi:uncharacterized RDD family membrane protein YckC